MRKVAVFLSVVCIMILSSCGNHNTSGTLTLKFNPMFGSSKLLLNQTYSTPDGKYYNFSTLKFYLSHIKLVRSDGSTVEVKPLAYISLDDVADMSISLPDSLGSFVAIQFSIGVDSTQDNVDPATIADTSNPQNANNNMFWDYTRKYVFVVLEGHGDQNTSPQAPLEYHVGLSPYYSTVQVNSGSVFTVAGGKQTVLTLNADIEKIFYGTASSINVLTDPYTEAQTTGANSAYYTTLAHTFMTDFSQTFSLTTQ